MADDDIDNLLEGDELRLNPPPPRYRVSFGVKSIFFSSLLIVFGVYLFIVVDRRMAFARWAVEDRVGAVKLSSRSLLNAVVIDPAKNQEISLYSLLGHWTLLNLWATWCPPCREEMPSLALLQQRFSDRLSVIALSVDDEIGALRDFMAFDRPGFRILWDQQQKLVADLGVKKFPETFLISPDGSLVYQLSGPRDWSSQAIADFFSSVLR